MGLVGIHWWLEGIGEPRLPMKGGSRTQNRRPETALAVAGPTRDLSLAPLPLATAQDHTFLSSPVTGCRPKRPGSSLHIVGFIRWQPCGQLWKGHARSETVLEPLEAQHPPCWVLELLRQKEKWREGAGKEGSWGTASPGIWQGRLQKLFNRAHGSPVTLKLTLVHREFQAQYGQAKKLLLSCNWILQAAVGFGSLDFG